MAGAITLTTKTLMNRPVVAVRGSKNKDRRIGKVRRFVFHPSEKRLIGVIIKRPDIALMFHRKDLFVALDSFEYDDGVLRISDEDKGTGTAAVKRLGVDWDSCVLWLGMQLVTESGESLGRVGNISFDAETGKVESVLVDEGATAAALLGKTKVPARMIKGFRWGIGDELRQADDEIIENDEAEESIEDRGAILLSDEVLDLRPEGGLAESAAKGSVKVAQKTKEAAASVKEHAAETADKLKPKAEDAVASAKPKMEEARAKAGEAMNNGAFAAGEHLAKSKTMFSDFAEEFKKGMAGEETETDKALRIQQETSAKEESSAKQNPPQVEKSDKSVESVVNSATNSVKKRTKGMFSGFMDEYRKAMKDD